MTVNILGTEYTIEILPKEDDEFLKKADGYCDKTSKRIVVAAKDGTNELDAFSVYEKIVMRHEIIHAFLFESGLHNNFAHPEWGHDETMVDWIATQGLKIYKAWESVGAL